MAVLDIKLFPDPVLRKKCSQVTQFCPALTKTIKEMTQTMKAQAHGIGIAAPQVGIPQQIAVVDVSPRVPGAEPLVLINPHIVKLADEKASREGCMSLPDYTGNIKRYEHVRLRWQDEAGEFHERDFQGIEAVCIQHEVDHLNGVLFMDRVISLKRDMIPREKPSKRL